MSKYGTRSYKERLKHKLVKNLRIQSDTQKIFIGMVSGLISKRKFTPHNITVPVLASYLALCFGQKIEHPIRLKNECGVNLRLNVFIRSAPDLKQLTQLEKAGLHPFNLRLYKLTNQAQMNLIIFIRLMFLMGQSWHLLLFIFGLFQKNIITIFTTNIRKKMSIQYMVP